MKIYFLLIVYQWYFKAMCLLQIAKCLRIIAYRSAILFLRIFDKRFLYDLGAL